MALRVLLADENVTIKKVIQLSLQDYAVTVKSVNLGVDVLDIAREFRPDIVFADILLQKRNGYEVCSDFKQDPDLNAIPFVLMWSGFMELDREKYSECQANGELEKPFDKDKLRELVQMLVVKTQSNELAKHTQLPDISFEDDAAAPDSAQSESQSIDTEMAEPITPISPPEGVLSAPADAAPKIQEGAQEASWSMDSFDDIEEFVQKPLSEVHEEGVSPDSPAAAPAAGGTESNESESWQQADLSNFKINIDPEETPSLSQEFSVDFSAADGVSGTDVDDKKPELAIEAPELIKPAGSDAPSADLSENLTRNLVPPEKLSPEPEVDFGTEADLKVTPEFPDVPETPSAAPASSAASSFTPPPVDERQIEEILRNHSREVIEAVAWKIIPDLAERIIREELSRIINETELT